MTTFSFVFIGISLVVDPHLFIGITKEMATIIIKFCLRKLISLIYVEKINSKGSDLIR